MRWIAAYALVASSVAQVPELRVANPRSIPYDFRCLAAADGRFVAGVGITDINNPEANFGALYTSTDGVTWVRAITGSNAFTAAAHGNGTFLAQESQGWIHTSPDGVTWQRQRQERSFWTIVHGAGVFVGLPFQGPIGVSTNGTAWTSVPIPIADYTVSVLTYGAGRFVALGLPGVAITSIDGRSWSAVKGPNFRVSSVAYGAGRFVASGTRSDFVDRDPVYAISSDGLDWTEISLPVGTGASLPATVSFANDRFFAFGQLASNKASPLWSSSDGRTWTVRENAIRTGVRYIAHNGTTFVAVGPGGGRAYSVDGEVWTAPDTAGSGDMVAAVKLGDRWFAFSSLGDVWASSDGSAWSSAGKIDLPARVVAAAASPTTIMVLCATGEIVTGRPETGWRPFKAAYVYGDDMFSLAYGAGTWVAGSWGGVHVSRDGERWQYISLGLNNLVRGITYAGNHFYAAGSGGVIAKSSDGMTWSTIQVSTTSSFHGIAGTAGKVIVVGQGGVIAVSEDGASWSVETPGETGFSAKHLSGIAYARGMFWAGGMGRVLVSTDGKRWQKIAPFPGVASAVNGVAGQDGTIVVMADRGLMAVADIPAPRIRNLSVLATLEGPSDALTLGYIVSGRDRAQTAPVVVRSVGPSLAPLGVVAPAVDPRLECYAGPTLVAENNDWSGTELATAMASVGAFPLPVGSRDAAAFLSAPTGQNTVVARALEPGAVLAEVYDATPAVEVRDATPRLMNVSVLKKVSDRITVGFVVAGTMPMRVLVRAVGPGLQQFAIRDAAADPSLTVFRNGNAVASNDDWGGTVTLGDAYTTVGAFSLPAASKDAAAILELLPGDYSVEVRGHVVPAGTVLVEVYALPPAD